MVLPDSNKLNCYRFIKLINKTLIGSPLAFAATGTFDVA
jgi:hypothetical protein